MIPARLSTTTTSFPWVSTEFGPSTIQRQPTDQQLQLGRPSDGIQDDRDLGVPSIVYMHNAMPTLMGFKSVQYKKLGEPLGDFDKVYRIQSKAMGIGYLFVATSKYTLDLGGKTTAVPMALGAISVASHRGTVYVFSRSRKSLYVLEDSGVLKLVIPSGIALSNILGIASIGPHFVMYTVDTILRSSIMDPLDFVPQLSTSAGAVSISPQRGKIITVQMMTQNSATIWTTTEAISLTISGSSASPFKLERVIGVPGISDVSQLIGHDKVAILSSDGYVLPDGKSTPVAADVWQFLTSTLIEDYIGDTGIRKISSSGQYYSVDMDEISECIQLSPLNETELVVIRALKPIRHKLVFVGDRYMCFSYGFGCSPVFNWVVVYDTQLRRWGKLRIKHTHILDYQPSSALTPLGIVVVAPGGQLLTLVEDCGNFDPSGNGTSDSVLIYGRLEHIRGRDLTLYTATITLSYEPTTPFSFKVWNSLNGHTISGVSSPEPAASYQGIREYRMRITGKGASFGIFGSFNLTAVSVEVMAGGYR